ncbi:MAG: hypothetical protein JWO79_2393 [Actinomycetia bacterium]|jgi:hypothetical protein|nr:hypothetical protein [Actinomycetes bacterium]MDQ1659822.1 hypothetical protein [Cryptosporangiaceae bacterium]
MTTSPAETATHPRPKPSHDGLDLSVTKILASALAAISAAVAASYLGAMGTIIGAGVGSIIATVSTSIYQHSIKRTSEKLKKIPLATVVIRQRDDGPDGPHDAADVPGVTASAEDDTTRAIEDGATTILPVPSQVPARAGLGEVLSSIRWGRVIATAAIVFVVSFGALLAYEQFIGKSVSQAVKGEKGGGNTLSNVVNSSPGPKVTPSRGPDASPSEQASPTPAAPSEAPAGSPSGQPGTEITPAPSTEQQLPSPGPSVPGGEPTAPSQRIGESPGLAPQQSPAQSPG